MLFLFQLSIRNVQNCFKGLLYDAFSTDFFKLTGAATNPELAVAHLLTGARPGAVSATRDLERWAIE